MIKLKTFQKVAIKRYWELLLVLVERNLKVRYRGSVLGIYWSLLNPLIMTSLYTAIFGATFSSYYNDSIINYILASFTGLTTFHFFSGSTSQALPSVVDNSGLLNKIYLPISVFPLSVITANAFQFLLGGLPLIALVTLIISKNLISVISLILPTIALICTCIGFAFFLSTLYVFFRDISYFYELVSFILWISSPVFYPAAIVPDKVRPFLLLNPLTPIIESIRQISLSSTLTLLDLNLIIHALLNGLIILGLGWIFFNWLRPKFIDLL
jgi:ABC-2 type transport system permease protein/lipopolysaccharide transport system permease protein